LVIDQITPTPDRDSGSVDQFNLISILQQLGWMVSFVPETNMEYRDVYTSNLQRIGVQCIYKPYYNNLYEFVRDEGDTVKLAILYKGPPTVHYLNIIIPHCQQARIIFNTVDIHYLREMREAELFNDSKKMANAMRTKKLEIEAIRRSDCTIILSPAEEQIIKSEIPDARLFVVPLIRNSPGRQARRSELKDVSFIGGFLHKPNCDAVHFFVANIWPLVHTKLPNVNFRIMGSNVPEDIKSLECESIVVDGFVSYLTTTFARCRVSVAPLRYGAGLKGKIASSLGFGIPCVATSVAAEGMVSGYINGIEVADEPKDFAEKIVRLYNDEAYWEKMSKHGVAFANSEYSIESTRDKFSMILNQLELPVDDFINNGGRHIFPDNQSTSRRNHLRNGRKSRSEVSVIVPLYNHEKYIAAALESVFTQTTPPTEVIVIDDGSTDQSADIAKRVCSGYKGAIFLSQSNIGAHNTINKAIQRSIQPIVAIINSDDIYNQNRLEKCLETINEQGKFIVATGIEFINEYNEFIENKWYTDAIENWKDIGNTSLALLNGNFIMTTSNLILHRRVFKDTGYFRDFRYAHDLDFFIRALGQGYKIEFISDALLKYRYHTSNTISENHTKVRAEWAYICAETFLNPKITILESLDFLNYTIKLSEILEKHRLAQGVFLIISVLKRYKYGMREFSEIISKPIISKALYNSLS
jgi:glycosyltransferase involved in cell wall biosynthesis